MNDSPRNPPITDSLIRLAVCASGGGTTLQNLIDRIDSGDLSAEIVLVVAGKPGIGAIERAERAGIPVVVADRPTKSNPDVGRSIFDPIRARRADLAVLAGFLTIMPIPPDFQNRVVNVHPSLIPSFCGKGFYGARVHQAALDYGVKVSGCTVHFADDTYDTGPIIVQRAVPVLEDDTAATLAARVFEEECRALPEAIRLYAEGRLTVVGRRVRITR